MRLATEGDGVIRISPLGLLLRRLALRTDGSAAVEFGLIVIPFFALILGSLQLVVLFIAQQILETATETAARSVLTGNAQNAGLTQAQFQTALCANIPALLKCSNVLIDMRVSTTGFGGATVTKPSLVYNVNGVVTGITDNNATSPLQFAPGSPGQIVVMRVMYQWPVFNLLGFSLSNLANGTRLLMAVSVFKNEIYQ